MRTSRVALLALSVCLLTSPLWARPARAQTTSEVPPPPAPAPEAPPAVVTAPAPQPTPAPQAAPASSYAAESATPYVAQPQTAQPVYGGQYGVQQYGQPVALGRPPRRGDRLEDTAQTGEVVDLMITIGAFGVFLGNSIVTWGQLDTTFDPRSGTLIRSSDDVIRIRFVSTLLGATLALSGLLAAETPRGVPTMMAVGLRYGVLLSFLGYGGFAPSSSLDGNGWLGAVTVGGLLGVGIGAGLGYALRPHPSRTRFVEAGGVWGTGFGGLVAGAITAASRTSDARAPIFGGLLAGAAGGLVLHSIVAATNPVSAGRGWLLNAAFAAGAGLGAFLTWGFAGGSASGESYMGISAATGFIALAVIFGLTDGLQDSGWDESLPEVVRSMHLDIGPTQDGAMGMLSGQF